jgi:hypothetical protein
VTPRHPLTLSGDGSRHAAAPGERAVFFAVIGHLSRQQHAAAPQDGWCDDPAAAAYNRPVRLPYAASAERLWREDGIYDLIVPLGYNDDPVVPGAGSAIFLHVAHPDYAPTEGCVALAPADLMRVLGSADTGSRVVVHGPEARPPGGRVGTARGRSARSHS